MNRKWPAIIAATIATVLNSACLAAGVDDAWNPKTTSLHGNPSITVGPNETLSVVLPRSVLQESKENGFSTQPALLTFLQRYGPRLCSHLLDLYTPHKNLKVELHVLERASKEDQMLVVSPEHEDFVLDDSVANSVHCVGPSGNVF
jgi:hypothetical protein